MALRFFLVALVAALGFDPPSSEQVSQWSRAGQEWIAARLDDLSGATLVTERAKDDASFDLVVDDMATNFSIDLAAIDQPKPKITIAFEPIAVPDVLDTDIAHQLNSQAGGEGCSSEFVGPLEPSQLVQHELVGPPSELAGVTHELVGPPVELAGAPTTSEAETGDRPETGKINRIVSAVQLTRQAAQAWMTLFSDSGNAGIRR